MNTATTPAVIVDNPAENRFETVIDGHVAKVDYKIDGTTITLEHTTVPEALQGRGLAGQLMKAAMDFARQRGLSIVPVCEIAVGFMKKRPETHDLLTTEGLKAIA